MKQSREGSFAANPFRAQLSQAVKGSSTVDSPGWQNLDRGPRSSFLADSTDFKLGYFNNKPIQKLAITNVGLKMIASLASDLPSPPDKPNVGLTNPTNLKAAKTIDSSEPKSPRGDGFKREVFLRKKFSVVLGPYQNGQSRNQSTKQLEEMSPRLSTMSGLSHLGAGSYLGQS